MVAPLDASHDAEIVRAVREHRDALEAYLTTRGAVPDTLSGTAAVRVRDLVEAISAILDALDHGDPRDDLGSVDYEDEPPISAEHSVAAHLVGMGVYRDTMRAAPLVTLPNGRVEATVTFTTSDEVRATEYIGRALMLLESRVEPTPPAAAVSALNLSTSPRVQAERVAAGCDPLTGEPFKTCPPHRIDYGVTERSIHEPICVGCGQPVRLDAKGAWEHVS